MRTFLAGLGVMVSLSVVYVGCGLTTRGNQADGFAPTGGGSSGSGGSGGSGPTCMSQMDCPADSDCKTYTCKDSHCQVTLLPEGTEVQNGKIVGDCKKIVCTAGGTTTLTNADDDPPASPDPCTTKTCGGGDIVSTPQPDNTICGAGLFCEAGKCVGCMAPQDCPDPPDCQTVDCQNKACIYTQLGDGTEVEDLVSDDCMHVVCTAGVKNTVPDMSETPPPDNSICTDDTCDQNGNPKYVAAMEGVVCGAPAGVCFLDSVCNTGTCAPQFQMNGFLLTDVNPGNCKREACNGAGSTTQVNYDDPPADVTPTDCKTPACQNGGMIQNNVGNGAACMGASASTCCGGTCCGGAASVCSGAAGNSCCDSGTTCGTNCCNTNMAVCAGAGGTTCCESGTKCGTSCCASGAAVCAGAGGTTCCESGMKCSTNCCVSAGAKCSGAASDTCCETGVVCGTNCCIAGAACSGVTGTSCCDSGKVCGAGVCCGNATDGCVVGLCCPANKVCNGGTVCCAGGMTCQNGNMCVP